MKLFKVTFNDGDWHSGSLPSELVVASNHISAVKKARKEHPIYGENWSGFAVEVKPKGYKINILKDGKKKSK